MKRIIRAPSLLVLVMIVCFGRFAYAGETINKHFPDWLEMDLQFRYRYEWKANADFNDNIDDEKGFSLGRTRINVALVPTDNFRLFYQFQDARIWSDSKADTTSFEDWGETRQLWAQVMTDPEFLDSLLLSKAGIRLGRQELSYGAQRLIGGFNWSNTAQTFDAGKVILEFEPAQLSVDIFAGGQTPLKSPREQNDFYDGSRDDVLAGYYAQYNGLTDITIDQYFLRRDTKGKPVSFGQVGDGEVDDYTLGIRLKGQVPGTAFDYEFEAARQWGDSGVLDVNAQMAVVILGYTFDHPWKPRVAFEFDYASGDNNSTDGKRETFDNLYPTNHLYYGYMDFASLQNLNNYHFQIKAYPTSQLTLQGDLHFIYLDQPEDNFYSAGRGIQRAGANSASSHAGNELDLLAEYKLNDYVSFLAGYSHFFAGDFLKDTGPSDDADFVYAQTVLEF
ncbi:MAG: alginate export family protein [Candidatus Omnitrophica bacterium]|nr:alginate export family protein [Candidatus Omnitrophota bacterium]